VQSIDPELSADCPPKTGLPQTGVLTVQALLNRLDAVEAALAICRSRLQDIRELPLPADQAQTVLGAP
jgi:hypothetical protein